MQAISNQYLKLIPFADFYLWDVKRYYNKTKLNFENVIRLSDILIPYKRPVSKEEMIQNHWQIIAKINFGGELFLRDFDEINTYKGNVNLVPDNAIIYSKINVRHGCIYYHEKGKTPFGVSSEYPTYTFDESKISGKFLHKILRSDAFKKLLNTKTTGISKARVKQDEFLDIEIPLPSLLEQEKIIDAYNSKIEEAQILERKATILQSNIGKTLFEKLGVQLTKSEGKNKLLQIIDFDTTYRWDTLFLLGRRPSLKSRYPIIYLKEIITNFNKDEIGKSLRIDSSKYPELQFNYIGMENIEKETGNLLEMPKVFGNEIKSQTIRVPQNYLIYGKLRPYLNKYWINNTNFENIICSSEFFVFDINDKINKHFFKYLLSSQIIQIQISDKTSGARMPRINEVIFFNLQLPLPPREVQDEIERSLSNITNQIESLIAQTLIMIRKAEQEFENEIFN